MIRLFRKMNKYFFDEEEIGLSDALWFYGVLLLLVAGGVLALTCFIQLKMYL